MIAAIIATPGLANETETTGIVPAAFQRFAQAFLLLALGYVFVVKIAFLQVPDGRPAVVGQVSLVLRVQRLQDFRCFSTRHVVVGRQVSQAPLGQLISIVNLLIEKTSSHTTVPNFK
jgi:hypothetical protein